MYISTLSKYYNRSRNAICEIQCLLYTKHFGVAYFGVFGLFHFSLNILMKQSYESSSNTNKVRSLLELQSLFLKLPYAIHFIARKFSRPKILIMPLKSRKRYAMHPGKMNFAMQMNRVSLSSSHHNHLYMRCGFQSICDGYKDILAFHDKKTLS